MEATEETQKVLARTQIIREPICFLCCGRVIWNGKVQVGGQKFKPFRRSVRYGTRPGEAGAYYCLGSATKVDPVIHQYTG